MVSAIMAGCASTLGVWLLFIISGIRDDVRDVRNEVGDIWKHFASTVAMPVSSNDDHSKPSGERRQRVTEKK